MKPNNSASIANILATLEKELPPIIARRKVGVLSGGSIAPHTLANADAMGTGPMGKVMIGRNAAYTRDSFLVWLEQRMK
jgi:hypothetical protein